MQTFIDLLKEQAEQHPKYRAISLGETRINYENLLQGIYNVMHNARNHGVKPGDNLLFACKPTIESLTLALGLISYGASLSILDPFTSDALFKNRARLAEPKYTIAPPALYRLGRRRKMIYRLTRKQVADIATAAANQLTFGGSMAGSTEVTGWVHGHHPAEQFASTADRPAIIVFTSGTTSEPKGVVHTLKSLSSSILPFAELMRIQAGTRVYSEPMTLGLVALSVGAEWIIPDKEKQFPEADVWFGTPVEILKGLTLIRKNKQTVNLTTVAAGAAPVLPSLVNEIDRTVRTEQILSVYGMTEMLPIAVGDARLKESYLNEGDFLGYPVGGTNVNVVEGELVLEGPALMRKYLHTDLITNLPTGDYGTVLQDGAVIMKGRKKDMFIRGDMNIYPGLYEPGLATIKGVQKVALVGIPDKYGDDEVVLAVTALPGFAATTVRQTVLKEMGKFVDADAKPSDVIVLPDFPVSGRANKLDRDALTLLVKKNLGKG